MCVCVRVHVIHTSILYIYIILITLIFFQRYTYTRTHTYIYTCIHIHLHLHYIYMQMYIHPLTHSMLLLGSYMKLLFFLFRTFYPSPDWDTPTEFTADIWSISCLRNSSSNGRKKKCSCKRTENEATGKRCNFRFCLCELVDSTANSCRFWPAEWNRD